MRAKKRKFGVAIALLGVALLSAGRARAWQDRLDGSAHTSGGAQAVALDPAGAVIAAGSTDNVGTGRDLTIVKLDPASGALIWRRAIDGGLDLPDSAAALTVDAAGDVIVAGQTNSSPSLPPFVIGSGEFTVIKLSGVDGAVLWRYSFAEPGISEALALALDASGDVLVAGRHTVPLTQFEFSFFLVVKLRGADGAQEWATELSGGFAIPAAEAVALAVDGSGDAIAVGSELEADLSSSFLVAKMAHADGAVSWQAKGAGTSSGLGAINLGQAVAIDGSGDAVAAGQLANVATGFDFTVVRLAAATGLPVWFRPLDGGDSANDEADAVVVDASGDAIAAGEMSVGGTARFAVVKLGGAMGDELWRWTGGTGSAKAVRVDPAGDVIAAGRLDVGVVSGFGVVKLTGADGSEVWRTLVGDAGAGDGAEGLVLLGGDPVAAGTASALGEPRFGVARLSGDSGSVAGSAVPACTSGPLIDKPRVKIRRTTAGGRAAIAISGILPFQAGAPTGFDPSAQGAQLLLEDLGTGGLPVFDLTTRTNPIPPGALGTGCGPHDGWVVSPRSGRSNYVNRSGAVDPPACSAGSANGLRALKLVDRRASAGQIQLTAAARDAAVPTLVGPLRLTLLLSAAADAGDAGACGVFPFAAAQCTASANGKVFDCH